MMITNTNKNTHEIKDWINIYAKWEHLFKPEEIILEKLRKQFRTMRMLDIGIGGGRTTAHFAKLTKEYIGIDFDDNMIQACKKRFSDNFKNISFVNCDARSMDI